MANVIQIDSNLANAIAGVLLAAANTGLIDSGTSDQYRASLMPTAPGSARKRVWIIPEFVQNATTPAAAALCDDGSMWYCADVSLGANATWSMVSDVPQPQVAPPAPTTAPTVSPAPTSTPTPAPSTPTPASTAPS